MAGSSVPLKLIAPSATVTVGESIALTTTISLQPNAANTETLFNVSLPDEATGVGFYSRRRAPACGSQVAITLTASASLPGKLVDLADGNHPWWLPGKAATLPSTARNCPTSSTARTTTRWSIPRLLEPYGISIREADATRSTDLLMYVPLNVVERRHRRRQGPRSSRICSTGRARPTPGARPQLGRVVWAMQALTDRCDDSAFPKTLEEYQKSNEQYRRGHAGRLQRRVPVALYRPPHAGRAAGRADVRRGLVPDRIERSGRPWDVGGRCLREPGQVRQPVVPAAGAGPVAALARASTLPS